MKRSLVFAVLVLLVPSFAIAHVSVLPRESKPGAEERYTVRVPTEGAVATTHAVLEIPADVTVLEVLPVEGSTFETAKQGERITSITWRKAIPPKASAEFVFRARNPAAGEIVWKAHQHFSDGTVADWVGVAGDKRPASVTKLSAQSAAGAQSGDAAAIETWLKGYDTAFNAKDLDKLRAFIKCAACGRGVTASWSKGRSARYAYYHCLPPCRAVNITKARLEGLFVDELERFQPTPGYMRLLKESELRVWHDRKASVKNEVSSAEHRAKAIQQKLDRLDDHSVARRRLLLCGDLRACREHRADDRDLEGAVSGPRHPRIAWHRGSKPRVLTTVPATRISWCRVVPPVVKSLSSA